MKTLMIALLVGTSQAAHAVPSVCEYLFSPKKVVTPHDVSDLSTRIDRALQNHEGPATEKEIETILAGDVQQTLVSITNMMRADDRLMDDILQGRNNKRSAQVATEFAESLKAYRQVKLRQTRTQKLLSKTLPKLISQREEELRAKVPQQSAHLQSVRAELERDASLLEHVKVATLIHLDELEHRTELLKLVLERLADIIPGTDVLDEAMRTKVRFQILSQIDDMTAMSLTSKASIKSIEIVGEEGQLIIAAIRKGLEVGLTRTAVETKTPSLLSSLQAGATAAQLIRVNPEHGALAAFGSEHDFARLRSVVLTAKDSQLGLSAFKLLIKRQSVDLPATLVQAFKGPNADLYLREFLIDSHETTWTLNMDSVHSLILQRIVNAKTLNAEFAQLLEAYSRHHAYGSVETAALTKSFLNQSSTHDQRLLAATLLLQHPQAHVIDVLTSALEKETDSKFVEAMRTRLAAARESASSTDLAEAIGRDLVKADAAHTRANLDEQLQRLQTLHDDFLAAIGQRDVDFWVPGRLSLVGGRRGYKIEWQKILRTSPHPARGPLMVTFARALMRQKRSSFHGEATEMSLNHVIAELRSLSRAFNDPVPAASIEEIRRNLFPYKETSRVLACDLWLDLVGASHVEGFRALLDEQIAAAPAGDYQSMLIARRLEVDDLYGPDALSEMYEARMKAIFAAIAKSHSYDTIYVGASLARRVLMGQRTLTNEQAVNMKYLALRGFEAANLENALAWAEIFTKYPALIAKRSDNGNTVVETFARATLGDSEALQNFSLFHSDISKGPEGQRLRAYLKRD